MKFYRKRLNSLEELRREKLAMKRAVKECSKDLFNPFAGDDDAPKKKKKKSAFSEDQHEAAGPGFDMDGIMNALSGLIGANPLVSAVVLPFIKDFGLKAGKKVGKAGASMGYRLAKEVLVGYLKWKAIELGMKGVTKLVKHRQRKNREKKAAGYYR